MPNPVPMPTADATADATAGATADPRYDATTDAGVVDHNWLDDAHALVAGALFVALGLTVFAHVGLLTGGVAGAAFVASYASGASMGLLLFVLNLPFFVLAWRQLGAEFTLKSFAAVALVSLCNALAPRVVSFDRLNAWVAAVLGGFLIGFGLLALLRHHASVGGINILAQWLQVTRGIRAGKVQLVVDCAVVAAAIAVVDPLRVLQSLVGAVVTSAVAGAAPQAWALPWRLTFGV